MLIVYYQGFYPVCWEFRKRFGGKRNMCEKTQNQKQRPLSLSLTPHASHFERAYLQKAIDNRPITKIRFPIISDTGPSNFG